MDKGPGKVGPCCLRPEICNKTTNFFLFLYRNFQKIVFNSNYNSLVIKMWKTQPLKMADFVRITQMKRLSSTF